MNISKQKTQKAKEIYHTIKEIWDAAERAESKKVMLSAFAEKMAEARR